MKPKCFQCIAKTKVLVLLFQYIQKGVKLRFSWLKAWPSNDTRIHQLYHLCTTAMHVKHGPFKDVYNSNRGKFNFVVYGWLGILWKVGGKKQQREAKWFNPWFAEDIRHLGFASGASSLFSVKL